MTDLFVPDRDTLARVASVADVLDNLAGSSRDWERRQMLTPPGLIWSVASDTCMTGRMHAPLNIAYDEYGAEFVFRQPRDESELAALMKAARAETFDCYRFDGLERWTYNSAAAWHDTCHVIEGWLEHTVSSEDDAEIAAALRAYREYLAGDEFRAYMAAILEHLKRS